MKTKRLLFISCLAAGALIASPSFGKPAKKSAGMSQFKAKRVAPHTTQVMRNDRHNQKINRMGRMGGTRYYGGTRYSGTPSRGPPNIPGRVLGGSVTPVHVTMANGLLRWDALLLWEWMGLRKLLQPRTIAATIRG